MFAADFTSSERSWMCEPRDSGQCSEVSCSKPDMHWWHIPDSKILHRYRSRIYYQNRMKKLFNLSSHITSSWD